jgi:uncharacterized protein (UPF0332 family)
VLDNHQKQAVARYLRLAQGLFETANITNSASEYEIRNAISRLYYAFFHASLALLLSVGWDVDAISKEHGRLHDAVQARMGKWIGRFFRTLYRSRCRSDYDTVIFERLYGGDVAKAQRETILLLQTARTYFYWLYREARKSI